MAEQKRKNKCVLCGNKTDTVFNINLKPVFICDSCAALITLQNVKDLVIKQRISGGINKPIN